MPDHQPPATPPAPPDPQQVYSVHWPLGGGNIVVGDPGPLVRRHKGHRAVILTVTLNLAEGVELDQDATLSLLYVVNGSLDYSKLFSQVEVERHTTATFKAGQAQTSFTITTLPIPPNSTFELEIVAYPASLGTTISGSGAMEPTEADAKSLKGLNMLSTVALVTALGALAMALMKRKD